MMVGGPGYTARNLPGLMSNSPIAFALERCENAPRVLHQCGGDGGSGGFFLACDDILENVRPFIPRLRLFFFFYKVEISSRTLIPLFGPGSVHSVSAS